MYNFAIDTEVETVSHNKRATTSKCLWSSNHNTFNVAYGELAVVHDDSHMLD
jgi:hypothetical protein